MHNINWKCSWSKTQRPRNCEFKTKTLTYRLYARTAMQYVIISQSITPPDCWTRSPIVSKKIDWISLFLVKAIVKTMQSSVLNTTYSKLLSHSFSIKMSGRKYIQSSFRNKFRLIELKLITNCRNYNAVQPLHVQKA